MCSNHFAQHLLLQWSPLFSGLEEKKSIVILWASKQHPHCEPPNAALQRESSFQTQYADSATGLGSNAGFSLSWWVIHLDK